MRLKLTAIVLFAAVASSTAIASPADDIKSLMEQNKPQEAYLLGREHPDQLGDPYFDFFFGIAALDAGHAGEGVLALERYILNFPENRSALFHLGRGYYILGEDQRARDELEKLRPAASGEEQTAIEHLLDAIRARESRYQPTSAAYFELGIGYDSNINSGALNGILMNIPGRGFITSDTNSVGTRESDFFYTYSGGAQGNYPIAPGIALYGSANFDARNYFKDRNDVFEQFSYGGNGGISVLVDKNIFKAGFVAAEQVIDQQDTLFSYGVTGEWSHQYSQSDRLTMAAQVGHQEFENTMVFATKNKIGGKFNSGAKIRSNDNYSITGIWNHLFDMSYQPMLAVSAGYGHEENTHDRPDLTRDLFSTRAQLSLTPKPNWGVALGFTHFIADHKGKFRIGTNAAGQPILAAESRNDTTEGLDASVSYRIDKSLSVRVEAQWSKQNSNVGLFDYERSSVIAKLRYEIN